jgi:hypothetical protein
MGFFCRLFDDAEVSSLVKATIDLLQFDHRTFSLSVGMFLVFPNRKILFLYQGG